MQFAGCQKHCIFDTGPSHRPQYLLSGCLLKILSSVKYRRPWCEGNNFKCGSATCTAASWSRASVSIVTLPADSSWWGRTDGLSTLASYSSFQQEYVSLEQMAAFLVYTRGRGVRWCSYTGRQQLVAGIRANSLCRCGLQPSISLISAERSAKHKSSKCWKEVAVNLVQCIRQWILT